MYLITILNCIDARNAAGIRFALIEGIVTALRLFAAEMMPFAVSFFIA